MGRLFGVVCLLLVVSSCDVPSLHVNPRQLASNLSELQHPPKTIAKKAASKEDCMYQDTEYSKKFIDEIAEFEKGYWDAATNTMYIDLINKDLITVQQEGCDYYSLEISWLKAKDTHALTDLTYWLSETKWLYGKLLEPYAIAEFNRLCQAENYHYTLKETALSLTFTNHEFSEWFLKINQTATGETKVTTGYYYK